MNLKVLKWGLKIIPETAQDEIYIERFLGLNGVGDQCECVLALDPHNSLCGGRSIEIRPIVEALE